MSKYLLVGLLLLGTPALAENTIYDGPVAIRPLTVIPKGYPIHPPITIPPKAQPEEPRKVLPHTDKVCDYQNQCFSTSLIPHKPIAPPIPSTHRTDNYVNIETPPIPKTQHVVIADAPLVSEWKNCMSRALGSYYQTHNQQELQIATDQCQSQLSPPSVQYDVQTENLPQIRPDGRRNIGCGWWPIGSDADRDCAAGQFIPNEMN